MEIPVKQNFHARPGALRREPHVDGHGPYLRCARDYLIPPCQRLLGEQMHARMA